MSNEFTEAGRAAGEAAARAIRISVDDTEVREAIKRIADKKVTVQADVEFVSNGKPMPEQPELTLEQQKAVAVAAGLDISLVEEGSVRVFGWPGKDETRIVYTAMTTVSRADYDKAVGNE